MRKAIWASEIYGIGNSVKEGKQSVTQKIEPNNGPMHDAWSALSPFFRHLWLSLSRHF
jgi:hypothetical protein